jgi:hypothetical protein
MEHLIRKTKKLFKAAGPNNIEKSIVKKSKAIAGFLQHLNVQIILLLSGILQMSKKIIYIKPS